MFLAQFSEDQKQAFMTLAHDVVNADNVLTTDEEAMMAQYRQEMGLIADGTFDPAQAVACFAAAQPPVQKKALFELLALACADGEYEAGEQKLLEELRASFGLDDGYINACLDCLKKLTDVYRQTAELVG